MRVPGEHSIVQRKLQLQSFSLMLAQLLSLSAESGFTCAAQNPFLKQVHFDIYPAVQKVVGNSLAVYLTEELMLMHE